MKETEGDRLSRRVWERVAIKNTNLRADIHEQVLARTPAGLQFEVEAFISATFGPFGKVGVGVVATEVDLSSVDARLNTHPHTHTHIVTHTAS